MDLTSFVMGRASAGGGGGTTPTQTKTATPTTSAQDVEPDSGYLLSKVIVGAIPSQYIVPVGKKTITENGTDIDVSQFATADVAVPSGGGSSYTLLYSGEITDSYDSTSAAELLSIDLSTVNWDGSQGYLLLTVRDKAGLRSGYYYGSDTLSIWENNDSPAHTRAAYYSLGGKLCSVPGSYGIYAQRYDKSEQKLVVYHRYNSSSTRTIDGTFEIKLYMVAWPTGGNPYD